ncbi:MAG TPA: hypothetical protein PKC83_07720 [Gemmatimonadaceae bacterium]|nr:hypothetical protein [Gemmatimonadaceae bacterium]
MPTYEFRCPDGSIIERFFKISEVPSEIPAPDGSGMAVRVISGGAGLIFKGSGFYITDYGKDGKKDQRAASSPSADRDSASGNSSGASSSGATSSGSAASTPASGSKASASGGGTTPSSPSSSPGSAKPSGGE